MCLTVCYCCLLSLTFSLVLWSNCMSLTVFYSCLLSLTVGPSSMELLNVYESLLWLLAFSHCLSSYYRVAACLSLSSMFASIFSLSFRSRGVDTCLSLSLPVPCSCCMSLTVSSSSMLLVHVSHCLLWLLATCTSPFQ